MSASIHFLTDHRRHIVIKRFLEEEQLIEDSFRLAKEVFNSGFRPTFIVGLWRGGSSVGIYVQECLQYLGVKTDHISLRTSYRGQPHYKSMIENPEHIRVHGAQYLIESLNAEDSLLIVDDVYSSGHSIAAVIARLKKHLKLNMPAQVRVATLYQRTTRNLSNKAPDYCLYQTEDWLVFPYELSGLSLAEVKENKGSVADLVKSDRYR